MPLQLPRLWIVATPLGNLGDFSPRAREVLRSVDCILAEDTRRAAELCQKCDLTVKHFLSFFEHNELQRESEVLALLSTGKSLALISDAGTPLISDPGYRLVRACRKAGFAVSPVPGPSAPVTALCAAGLPPIPYTFLGFPPRNTAGRRKLFAPFATFPGTLIFFERKDRLVQSLAVAWEELGQRDLVLCRELTKRHEEFILTRLEQYAELCPATLLGELTVLIGPPEVSAYARSSEEFVRATIAEHMHNKEKKVREIVAEIRKTCTGWTKKELYTLLTSMKNGV